MRLAELVAQADARYELKVARSAALSIAEQLTEKVAAAVVEFMTGPLLRSPRIVGKPLRPPLEPAYSARRGSFRVLYLIDDEARTVTVTAVTHRSDAYR
jgi:mRNA-degrading endonuclease RelE of RelBE toxin-antitoxin system